MRLPGLMPLLALLLFSQSLRPQAPPSIHQSESLHHAGETPAAIFFPAPVTGEFIAAPDAFIGPPPNSALTPPASQPAVDKIVFGFYPYWQAGAAINYSRLTHLAYHSVDPATDGSIAAWNGWPASAPIAAAHATGVRVLLNITNFNMATSTFLATTASRTALINSVVSSVKSAGADGVVLDFEGMSVASERANLVSFTQEFRAALQANLPHAEIYLATPAVDWSGVYDYANLAANSDGLFIMAYDYPWAGATTAGPVAMLDSSATWGTYATRWTVNDYLAKTSGDHLILGVPYYGYDWPTASQSTVPSSATANGTAKIYSAAVVNAGTYGRQWNSAGSSPYYAYTATGQAHQCFYEDAVSLALKYDLAQQLNLAGTGMWALGYDGTRPELYDLLRDKFQLPWPMAIGDLMLVKGSGAAVNLSWGAIGMSASGKNLALANYKIYLGTTPDFLTTNPASAAAPAATNYSDAASTGTQFYQVTAVSAQNIEGLITPPVIVDDAQAAMSGTWTASSNVSGFWGAGYKVKAAGGTGSNRLLFTPNLPRAGRYFLLGHHSAATDRSARAPYTITGRFALNRRVEVDERYFGGAWVSLGDDDLAGGTTTALRLDDSAPVFGATTTYVIGDAILAAPDPRGFILDDRDAVPEAGWFTSTTVAGFYGDEYQALALPSAATLRWNLDLELEGDYLVETRWTAGANRTTAARYTVNDAAGAHPVTINQQTGGNVWTSLGLYHFHRSRSGSVVLSSAATTNNLIADAIRVTLQ